MTTIQASLRCDRDELQRRILPRDDITVRERRVDGDGERAEDGGPSRSGSATFEATDGPYWDYRRHITWEPGTDPSDGACRVEQRIELRLAIPYWGILYSWALRRVLTDGVPAGVRPWWSTPNRLSPAQSSMLAATAMMSVVVGALFGLLTQVLTFVAADLGSGTAAEQANVLVIVRLGTVITVLAMVLADRLGRRTVALWSLAAACALSVGAAAAPTLVVFTCLQFISRNLGMAGLLCVDTIVVEELPAGSRAVASGLTTLAYGLGAGFVVVILPLADLGPWGWRLTFAASALTAPLLWHGFRYLKESGRFERHIETAPEQRRVRISRSRLVVIGTMFFLLNVFLAPASQLQNDYLRVHRGFDGLTITIFTLLTATPGAIGILAGGRLADLRGRRAAIVPGLISMGVFGAILFATAGPSMWMAALAAGILGGLSAPALGVIAPELFPTGRRGGTRGTVNAIAVGGSVTGLLGAGLLIGPAGYGPTFALLALAPIAAAILAFRVPETRNRELEELS